MFDPKIIVRELHCSLLKSLPEDDFGIEICWDEFKCFNVKKLIMCISWCAN